MLRRYQLCLCLVSGLLASASVFVPSAWGADLRPHVRAIRITQDRSPALRLLFRSAPSARCTARVSRGTRAQRLGAIRTTARGLGGWQWRVAKRAPSGRWRFVVTCAGRHRRASGHDTLRVRSERPRRGPLWQRSTVQIYRGYPLGNRGSGSNTYPARQCTWYVKEKRPDIGNYWGNAGEWIQSAQRSGFPTGGTPIQRAIAVWSPQQVGNDYGHVAYVEAVLGDGRITVSEYNWEPLSPTTRTVSARGLRFIYFRPGEGPTGPEQAPPPAQSPPPSSSSPSPPDRRAVTSYDQMRSGAPYNGYFDYAFQAFTAQSNTLTYVGVTVGNSKLPAGQRVGYNLRLRICTSPQCSNIVAEAQPQIVNFGNTDADIGDLGVSPGATYYLVWYQPSPANGQTWVTYWWSGGSSIEASDQMQAVVRGYNR